MLVMAGIGIRTTPGALSITRVPPRMEIENRPADLRIESPPAAFSVVSTPPVLTIDSTAARQELGYYQMLALLDEIVAYTGRQFERAMADIRASGYALADIGSGKNMIAELARQRMFVDMNDRQFVVAIVPRTPPAIRIKPGEVRVDATASRPRVQITAHPPIISIDVQPVRIAYTPGQIRFFLREPGALDLTV